MTIRRYLILLVRYVLVAIAGFAASLFTAVVLVGPDIAYFEAHSRLIVEVFFGFLFLAVVLPLLTEDWGPRK